MAHTLYVHLMDSEPLLLEVEDLPKPTDTCVVGMHPRRRDNKEVSYLLWMHPRRRDNKEVSYLLSEVTTVIFPLTRVSFIEVMPSQEDEEVFMPFRNS
jgi:hypothetical protein